MVISQHTYHRVPPFLSTIDDPRAAHGGSLKGCGVCGGIDVISVLRSKAHNYDQVWGMEFRIALSWRMLSEGNWLLIEAGMMEGDTESSGNIKSARSVGVYDMY